MPVDHRFFEFKGPQSLRTLADVCGAKLATGADQMVSGIAPAAAAGPEDICFHEGDAKAAASVSSVSLACFIKESAASGLPEGVIALTGDHPRTMHNLAARTLYRRRDWTDEGDAPAIHESAKVSPGVVIGAGAAIGADVFVGPNTVIGPGVQIGTGSYIGPNATLQCALVGDHVRIWAGARIGESGFGVTAGPEGAEDVPQWGRVILQDHVTIGANTCIDRGAFDDTIIGERTKIDNLCQIAHNVIIGRNAMIASFTGISGSSVIGDGVMMGGQVGIADHVNIGAGARLAAASGIFRDIPPGEAWGGSPAKPLRQYFREVAWLQKQTSPKKKAT